MLLIQEGKWDEAGKWRGVRRDGKRSAILMCPKCSRPAGLTEHEIAPDGTVTPSVVCPYAGCNFHDWIKLEGWSAAP